MGIVTTIKSKAPNGITPPVPLTPEHNLSDFNCGKEPLDDWLKTKALRSEGRSARTYVVCVDGAVVGYYCFANGAVRLEEMPKSLRRNMPRIVPVTLLGRLAVDARYQGRGIGKGLLKDGLGRALAASKMIGSVAVMVHAIDDDAAAYYAGYGFTPFPEGKQTFFLPMETIAASI